MSVILLVRHGQASFGKSDYDALSVPGVRQSRILGAALSARGVEPDLLLSGGMRRHRQTLEHAADAAGWSTPAEVDAGWDEFDHEQVIAVHEPAYKSQLAMKADLARTLKPRQAFQEMFEGATARWTAGEHDEDYAETFLAFGDRVQAALRRTSARLEAKQTAVVFTSGGPISWVVAALLSPTGVGDAELWGRLNITTINSAVTKIVVGRRGTTLLSVNEHGHLETAGPGLVTYR